MGHRALSIQLDKDSINDAIDELKAYRNEMTTKLSRSLESLAILARDTAQAHFGTAVKCDYFPKQEVSLEYTITANGKAVGFLEFGAGTASDRNHPFASEAPYDVYPGSYSKDNARQFWMKNHWWFGGRVYTFVLPRRGLYNASEAVRRDAEKVIKDSFK